MAQVETKLVNDDVNAANIPENYFSDLPVRFGAFAGVMGSVSIMAVIGLLALATGQSVWLAPRVIASTLMGAAAETGFFAVILGTVMHLVAGALYGALFAAIMPRMPRAFWAVAGMVFGVAIWGIAWIGLPYFIEPVGVSETTYFSALIISHVTYGVFLGIAGSMYGYKRG